MANQNQKGLKRIWNAWFYSMAGIRTCWKNEAAFRQELVLSLFLAGAAFWVGETATQQVLLIGSCLVVLIAELLNSAIEAAIDRIGEDRHKLSGRAKDMGSAAVFASLVLVVVTWGLIGFERFVQ
jgi:diacylglycerol kinase (ATP)